jgi:hypothetical protein
MESTNTSNIILYIEDDPASKNYCSLFLLPTLTCD